MRDIGKENERITGRTYLISAAAALIIGMYDGLYGPGTGTFLIIALTVFAKLAGRGVGWVVDVRPIPGRFVPLVRAGDGERRLYRDGQVFTVAQILRSQRVAACA